MNVQTAFAAQTLEPWLAQHNQFANAEQACPIRSLPFVGKMIAEIEIAASRPHPYMPWPEFVMRRDAMVRNADRRRLARLQKASRHNI